MAQAPVSLLCAPQGLAIILARGARNFHGHSALVRYEPGERRLKLTYVVGLVRHNCNWNYKQADMQV